MLAFFPCITVHLVSIHEGVIQFALLGPGRWHRRPDLLRATLPPPTRHRADRPVSSGSFSRCPQLPGRAVSTKMVSGKYHAEVHLFNPSTFPSLSCTRVINHNQGRCVNLPLAKGAIPQKPAFATVLRPSVTKTVFFLWWHFQGSVCDFKFFFGLCIPIFRLTSKPAIQLILRVYLCIGGIPTRM